MDKQGLEFLEKDHKLIVDFLKNYFVTYCKKHEYPLKIDLDQFLNIAKDCFGNSQDVISGKYEAALQSTNNKTNTSQSKISRVIDNLNVKLKTFCDDNKISPPIQIYNYYIDSNKERRSAGFFFACAKTRSPDNNTAYDIVSLKKARQKSNATAVPLKLKYFRDMRDVLKWDDENIEPVWFRKSGPLVADFRAGFVYERKELLNELDELIANNKVSLLEGHGGSGKSVLIRNYAYNLISRQPDSTIYHFSFKTDAQVIDYHDFSAVLNSVTGLVIVEDIHLSTQNTQLLVESLNNQGESIILFTARPAFKDNMVSVKSKKLAELPCIKIGNRSEPFSFARDANQISHTIIDFYIKHHESQFLNQGESLKMSIIEFCKNDLWLLNYVLQGYSENGKPIDWIKKAVKQDLDDLRKQGYNPEILLALSPLYMNELLTSESFLRKSLNFNRKELQALVERNEIIEHEDPATEETHYGLTHSSLAKAYWEHGGRYRNLLELTEYRDFIYYYVASAPSNGLRAASTTDDNTYVMILYNLFLNNIALDVFQNEQDTMQFLSVLRAMPYLLKYPEGQSLISESFIHDFIKLLFEHKRKFGRKIFTLLELFLMAKTLSGLHIVAIRYFSDILYTKNSYGDACYFLARIYNLTRDHKNDIIKILDYKKLASLIEYLPDQEQLSYAINSLLDIDEDIAGRFIENIRRNRQDDLGWVVDWIKETYLFFKFTKTATGKIYKTEPRDDTLEDYVLEIKEKIYKRSYWPLGIGNNELRILILQLLFRIDENLALDLWRQLDKEHYVCKDKVCFNFVCQEIRDLSKLNEIIKTELIELIDCKNLAIGANQSNEVLEISKSAQCLFETDVNFGLKFWSELDKDKIINESEESFESVFSFIKIMMKTDETIRCELLKRVNWKRLALKANQSENICLISESIEYLYEIEKKTGIAFWNELNKDYLVHETASDMKSISSFLKKLSELDELIKSELFEIVDAKKLVLKANQTDNVTDLASLFLTLSRLNSKTGLQFWKLLDKKEYANKLLSSSLLDFFQSFFALSDVSNEIAKDFWKLFIDIPTFVKKIKECYSSFEFVFALCFISQFKDESEMLCCHFNTSILVKMFDKMATYTPLLPSNKMRTVIAFTIHGAAITEEYHKILSEGVEEYTNQLIDDQYSGWHVYDDDNLKQESIAANVVFDYICNKIGIKEFINKIMKSGSKEIIDKCHGLFNHLDPDDVQGWRKHFDQSICE